MPKQHEQVGRLRSFQRWRRGADLPHPSPLDVGATIDWAIRVCEAADVLVNGKAKNPDQAYRRLDAAVNGDAVAQEVRS